MRIARPFPYLSLPFYSVHTRHCLACTAHPPTVACILSVRMNLGAPIGEPHSGAPVHQPAQMTGPTTVPTTHPSDNQNGYDARPAGVYGYDSGASHGSSYHDDSVHSHDSSRHFDSVPRQEPVQHHQPKAFSPPEPAPVLPEGRRYPEPEPNHYSQSKALPATPMDHDVPYSNPSTGPATSTMDPNVPSSESAPTALPTNPSTHPGEQAQAVRDEHPAVVTREVEKTKAEEREIKGEKPEGTVVAGLEDDRLWTMLRRFDGVRLVVRLLMDLQLIFNSKSPTSFTQQRSSLPPNRIYDLRSFPTYHPTLKSSSPTSSGSSPRSVLRLSGVCARPNV